MMAWQEEPDCHHRNDEWPGTELLNPVSFFASDGSDERAQRGASNFATVSHDASQAGLTYSASCPSLSELDDVDVLMGGTTNGGQSLVSYPFGAQESPLVDGILDAPSFAGDKSLEMLLQFQQEYQNVSQRQYPHQQAMMGHQPMDLRPQARGGRRGIHSSQSFTSLSSMEADYNRIHAHRKQKKASERWIKLQRHKSFDSTVPITEPMDFDPSAFVGGTSMSSSRLTPDQLLQEPVDDDMVGYDVDDASSPMPSDDPNWPPLAYASTTSYSGDDYMQQTPHKHLQQQQQHDELQILSDAGVDFSSSANVEPVSELDILLSDHERSTLFDAIRDFDLPCGLKSVDVQLFPEQAQSPTQTQTAIDTKEVSDALSAGATETTGSPSLSLDERTKSTDEASGLVSLDSTSSTPPARLPPSGSIPMRTRLHQILVLSVQNTDATSSLSSYERNYLTQSSLFLPAKAPETAGSLWLLLHAAQCEAECEIADCGVMRRVLNHCLGCELMVGKCKQPCNDAKAMLLHYGSCNSKGSMHGRSCSVCWNLLEIDYSHQALSNGNSGDHCNSHSPSCPPLSFASSSTCPPLCTPPSVPIPSSAPVDDRSPAYRSSPGRSTKSLGTSKHVRIQPNPLPTASNPLGLLGSLPQQLGHSLSLYLEQTSALFRAEVKTRIEKRVTAAAGQDLLQHMQKKTRLRSLDDLRSEARAVVLREMEQKLVLYMQAYNWASSSAEESVRSGASQLPPYLRHFSAAAFHAQQQTSSQAEEQVPAHSLPPVGGSRPPDCYKFAQRDPRPSKNV
uniref:TAZ-type domain-containing protein n=1 Tax=Peronospora matthiolae TaxID=2874970 RepID=A0AAV1TRS7_9STRA